MSFLKYFEKIFRYYPNPKLYLKGGSVISIKLLQDINYLSDIKDFDFVLEDERCCNDYFYYEFGKEFGIFLNGYRKPSQGKNTQLHVMRYRKSSKYELSVCIKDTLELPMTSMRIYFDESNYISLFNFLENIDYNILKEINIVIPDHDENGMFNEKFQFNNTIIENIILNTINNNNYQQCLYHLIKNPTNISRLKYKNIPKSQYIKKLYQSLNQLSPTWLLNEDLILDLVEKLIVNITLYVNDIYEYYKDNINILTEQIINKDDLLNIYECIHDLVSIGCNSYDVIDFLNGKNDDQIIRESLHNMKLNNKKIDKIIDKCKKYNVNLDMMNPNIFILKNKIKVNRDLLRTDITILYIEMFQKLDYLFEDININRWKDNFNLSDPLLDIFQFSHKLKMKLYDAPIIINGKILSKSASWSIVNKIKTLK